MEPTLKRLLPLLVLLTLPATVEAQFTFTTNNGAITISNLLSQPRRASSSAMMRLALCSAISRWSSPEWLSPSLPSSSSSSRRPSKPALQPLDASRYMPRPDIMPTGE